MAGAAPDGDGNATRRPSPDSLRGDLPISTGWGPRARRRVLSAVLSAALLGLSPARFVKVLRATAKQVFFAEVTIAAVLALAFVMNYSGATATLGLVFADYRRSVPLL